MGRACRCGSDGRITGFGRRAGPGWRPCDGRRIGERHGATAEFERARFYIRRVNTRPELVTAESLWLAARIEHRLGNAPGVQELGRQLRSRFPQALRSHVLRETCSHSETLLDLRPKG